MTALMFAGKVEIGYDDCRVDYDDVAVPGAILIDGEDWFRQVAAAEWAGKVIVGIGDQRFIGEIDAFLGWGYSEYTPVDSDRLTIGPHNIIDILEELDGKLIVLTISDEVINLQEVRDRAEIAVGKIDP